MLPPRPIPSRMAPKGPRGVSPKGMVPRGIPSRAMKKAPPPKAPSSIFGERKYWEKPRLRERVKKLSPFILKGKMFKGKERVAMIEQWFPYKRFGTHVTEGEAKTRLRELRRAEYRAKSTKEKSTYKWQRRLLEAFTGIRKY